MSFLKNFATRGSQGFVGQSSPYVALRVEQPSVLKFFFQNYNILPRSGVREESLPAGSEICQISSLFGPPCTIRYDSVYLTCSKKADG